MTQPELARACGWLSEDGSPAQGRVSNYERGIREPTIQDVWEIGKATGKNITYFYDVEGPEETPSENPPQKAKIYSSLKELISSARDSGESELLEDLLLEVLMARRSRKRS